LDLAIVEALVPGWAAWLALGGIAISVRDVWRHFRGRAA
jgi:hypothetical protein